jgi:hypothetical protein
MYKLLSQVGVELQKSKNLEVIGTNCKITVFDNPTTTLLPAMKTPLIYRWK